jgi:hypothetical protein
VFAGMNATSPVAIAHSSLVSQRALAWVTMGI